MKLSNMVRFNSSTPHEDQGIYRGTPYEYETTAPDEQRIVLVAGSTIIISNPLNTPKDVFNLGQIECVVLGIEQIDVAGGLSPETDDNLTKNICDGVMEIIEEKSGRKKLQSVEDFISECRNTND